jgi:hypothetical protein
MQREEIYRLKIFVISSSSESSSPREANRLIFMLQEDTCWPSVLMPVYKNSVPPDRARIVDRGGFFVVY